MRRILLISSFHLFILSAFAQKMVDQNTNGWYMHFGDHRVSEHWGFHTEYQARRSDIYKYWQQSLVRLGVNYWANNGPFFTVGITHIRTWPYGSQPAAFTTDEINFFEQMILTHNSGRFNFNHRYRFEQRLAGTKPIGENGNIFPDEYNVLNRARYRFMMQIPITKKTMDPGALYLALFDEMWVNFGGNIGQNIFDQNWIYGAFGYRFSQSMSLECGYLNQYIFKSDGIHAENNHTFQLAWFYNLDFRQQSAE